MLELVISFRSNDRSRRRFAPFHYGLTGGRPSGLPRPARYQLRLVLRPRAKSAAVTDFFRIYGAVTISETRSIPGCTRLTFLPPIGGNAHKSWLFGGVGPRRYEENADNN